MWLELESIKKLWKNDIVILGLRDKKNYDRLSMDHFIVLEQKIGTQQLIKLSKMLLFFFKRRKQYTDKILIAII